MFLTHSEKVLEMMDTPPSPNNYAFINKGFF